MSGEFVGGIRCLEVHRTPGSSVENMQVWTGEQDGALCVRDGLGKGLFTIEKKKKVFVTCLMCHGWDSPGRFMYAGMSDGYIRVYDRVKLADGVGVDYELVCETKKHTASITCMLSVRELIVTGGRDWQIFIWRWDGPPAAGGTFRAIDQFWGHQNAVRCLTYDQGPDRLLYSGGDDCSIKCLELETGHSRSVPGGFPIEGHPVTKHGHRQGIRAIVVYERYLFSASEDGYIKVWDSQDGTFVRAMYKPQHGHVTAILSLLKDPAGGRIWSGGADGVIRVFSAYDHIQICQIEDPHNGAMVTNLTLLGRLNAIKGWFVTKEGTCRVIYSESDDRDTYAASFSPNEAAMTYEIEELRATTIQDCRDLDKRKKQLMQIQKIAGRRKEQLVTAMARQLRGGLRLRFYQKLMIWLTELRDMTRRVKLAHIIAATNNHALCTLYMRKLSSYTEWKKDYRSKMQCSKALLLTTQRGMQLVYWGKIREWVRRDAQKRHKGDVVHILMHSSSGFMRNLYFHKWLRWLFRVRQQKKRNSIVQSLRNCSTKGLMTTYYYKLIKYYHNERTSSRKRNLVRIMTSNIDTGIQRIYLSKCIRWLTKRKNLEKKKLVSETLMKSTDEGLRRVYLAKCRAWLIQESQRSLNEKQEEIDKLINELERKLAESSHLTDSEISRLEAECINEIAELEDEILNLENQIKALDKIQLDLQIDLRNVGREIITVDNDKIPEAAMKVCVLLKAHGVNCGPDLLTIQNMAARKSKNEDTATLFVNGLKKTKNALASLCSRQGIPCDFSGVEWDYPYDITNNLSKRLLDMAHVGIKELVIACDMARDPRSTREFSAKVERAGALRQLVQNQSVLYDIVLKVYEERSAAELLGLGREAVKAMGLWETSFGAVQASHIFEKADEAKAKKLADRREHVNELMDERRDHEEGNHLPVEHKEEHAPPPPPPASPRAGKPTAKYKFDNTLKLTEVTSGGPADKAGMKVGDKLGVINGARVKDKRTYGDALAHVKVGIPIKVSYTRGAKVLRGTVVFEPMK
eukprot:TRINITY_DN3795_c0_g1_i1.p1 TRINITY_DN3795_c0_g1~~TRINITY_DN3795_c0_g1_i1.p1  ORF type:complete len:1092 (+),score=223.23 TRINITY_DN3795_c0_g1_i1:187-3276(+)